MVRAPPDGPPRDGRADDGGAETPDGRPGYARSGSIEDFIREVVGAGEAEIAGLGDGDAAGDGGLGDGGLGDDGTGTAGAEIAELERSSDALALLESSLARFGPRSPGVEDGAAGRPDDAHRPEVSF